MGWWRPAGRLVAHGGAPHPGKAWVSRVATDCNCTRMGPKERDVSGDSRRREALVRETRRLEQAETARQQVEAAARQLQQKLEQFGRMATAREAELAQARAQEAKRREEAETARQTADAARQAAEAGRDTAAA